MARQVGRTLQVVRSEVVPKMTPDANSKEVPEDLSLRLYDMDPQAETKSRLHIDLDLDQIEDSAE